MPATATAETFTRSEEIPPAEVARLLKAKVRDLPVRYRNIRIIVRTAQRDGVSKFLVSTPRGSSITTDPTTGGSHVHYEATPDGRLYVIDYKVSVQSA